MGEGGGGFHADPQAGITQSRPEFANWRPTHRLDPASRCVLFGPHGVFKKLTYLPTFINGNILHKNPAMWLLLENRLSSHSQSAFLLEQQQAGEEPPAPWVQPVLSGSPVSTAPYRPFGEPPACLTGLPRPDTSGYYGEKGFGWVGTAVFGLLKCPHGTRRPPTQSFADLQRSKKGSTYCMH